MTDQPPEDKVVRIGVRHKGPRKPIELVPLSEGCPHLNIRVDERLNQVQCNDCKKELNPIWYLAMMAKQLTTWDYEKGRIMEARKDLAERKQCRCEHCGRVTRIRRVSRVELKRIQEREGKPE